MVENFHAGDVPMHVQIQREDLLKPLGVVANVVERRQLKPVLSHVLLTAGTTLTLLGTDLDVELKAVAERAEIRAPGAITVPGRKLLDIVRAMPALATIDLRVEGERMVIKAKTSRFTLVTLPAAEFPASEDVASGAEVVWPAEKLRRLLEKTHFCMAQQDARYFLNGLLLDVQEDKVRMVATDGHRLAMASYEMPGTTEGRQAILPRKAVAELIRLCGDTGAEVRVGVSGNHVQASVAGLRLLGKLIDGRFPDYEKVIPQQGKVRAVLEREALKESLHRVAILASEKYRGVRFGLSSGRLSLSAQNPEQEEAREEIPAEYEGDEVEMGFNVNYVLDAISALEGDEIEISMVDADSSATLRSPASTDLLYVVMPMRL